MLAIAALLPAVFLIAYVYKKDTIEKEPRELLWRLVLFGALSTIPAAIIELVLEQLLWEFYSPWDLIYQVISNFLIIAVAEEFWKRQVVLRLAWNHPAFNYRFDAVVYSVCAAMGFAALENVLYVWDGGFYVAVSRALLAVPTHAVAGVLMGCYLGEAKVCEHRGDWAGRRKNMALSLLYPVLAHGFYDFCLMRGTNSSMLAFILYVVTIDIVAVRQINRSSREDAQVHGPDGRYW